MGDEPGTPPAARFYGGRIKRLFVGAGRGVVLSDGGREIPFLTPHVELSGNLRRFDDLREGMRVGFDVGWTSRGLRVTRLHTGDDEGPPAEPT